MDVFQVINFTAPNIFLQIKILDYNLKNLIVSP